MFSKDLKVASTLDYASGTAARYSSGVDFANIEWAIFIVKMATIAAGGTNSLKLQQSSDDASADAYADLEGTGVTVAADDDNQVFVLAIEKPRERYVRLYVSKDGSNACAESAVVVTGGGRTLPDLASVADAVTAEWHVSPAEGTA